MTKDGEIVHGVMLVNMNFTGIEQICKNVDLGESGYAYIIDRNGELIYHPRQPAWIYGGIIKENNKKAARYSEGSHMERFEGKRTADHGQDGGIYGMEDHRRIPDFGYYDYLYAEQPVYLDCGRS